MNTTRKKKGDLRILFWNIRHWNIDSDDPTAVGRFERILALLRREKPDVAVFAEVMDPVIKTRLSRALPGHTVFESSDRDTHHLAAVFNHAAGHSVSLEQRNEFTSDALPDRAFPLVRIAGRDFNLAVLGVHSKSGSTPESMAMRQRTLGQIANLNAEMARDGTPLVAIGDMNTMGNSADVNSPREIAIMDELLADAGMTRLPNDKPHTWHGVGPDARYDDCTLDHALVSSGAAHRVRPTGPGGARVRVVGWPDKPAGPVRDNWVRDHSDHAALVLDISPR